MRLANIAKDLLLYLAERPTAYLDDIAYYLFSRHGVDVSIPTVSRLLQEAQWTLKITKKEAEQRNAALRSH